MCASRFVYWALELVSWMSDQHLFSTGLNVSIVMKDSSREEAYFVWNYLPYS